MAVLLLIWSGLATTGVRSAFSSGPTPASAVTTAAPSASAVAPASNFVNDMVPAPTAPVGYAEGASGC